MHLMDGFYKASSLIFEVEYETRKQINVMFIY